MHRKTHWLKLSLLAFALSALSVANAATDLPHIPTTNQVARYEREQPVFQSTLIPKSRGDALLTLLDAGRATEPWMKDGYPPGVICVLPQAPHLWVNIALTNGTTYHIGLTRDGALLHLSEGFYVVTKPASQQVAKWMDDMEADLRREVLNTPRPCIYKIGTLDADNGSLSGVARLFYNDANKWPKIFEANRKVLKNPKTHHPQVSKLLSLRLRSTTRNRPRTVAPGR